MEKYEELKTILEDRLSEISRTDFSPLKQARLSITVCLEISQLLKTHIIKKSFPSEKEEIFFFKYFKPQIASKLIYYIYLFNIESKMPTGSTKQLRKYFYTQLKSINEFKKNNIMFYQYYRCEQVNFDEKYFIRNSKNSHLTIDYFFMNYDPQFNTSHDLKVAQIIAFDHLTLYLHKHINNLDQNLFADPNNLLLNARPLKWTDSKNALIELIYALQASGSFNKGRADVKEIATYLEQLFQIDLGDLYRSFHELRLRKTNRTKFLDNLKENLIKRMDTIDEKIN